MKITLIAVGKLKTPGLEDSFSYYKSKLQNFSNFKIIEIKPERIESKSPELRRKIQSNESKKIIDTLLKLKKDAGSIQITLLDETGQSLSSHEWSDYLNVLQDRGTRECVFVVGGSLGFSQELKLMADKKLNLGKATLPHELARVVLTEQIFRALSILANHPYHNEGE